jgi:hypothetical protein
VPQVFNASLDVSNATASKESDSEVSQTRHVCGTVFSANRRAVLPKCHIFRVMECVLYEPVPTLPLKQSSGVNKLMPKVSDDVDRLCGFFTGLYYLPSPHYACHLLYARYGELSIVGIYH